MNEKYDTSQLNQYYLILKPYYERLQTTTNSKMSEIETVTRVLWPIFHFPRSLSSPGFSFPVSSTLLHRNFVFQTVEPIHESNITKWLGSRKIVSCRKYRMYQEARFKKYGSKILNFFTLTFFFSFNEMSKFSKRTFTFTLFYRIANTLFLRDEKYEWLNGNSNMSLFRNERRNLLRPCFHSSISFTRIVEKLNKFKFPFKLHDIITSIVFSIIFSVTIIFLLFQYLDLLLIVRTKNKKKREIIILRLFQSIRRIHRNIIARVFLFIFIFSLFFNN